MGLEAERRRLVCSEGDAQCVREWEEDLTPVMQNLYDYSCAVTIGGALLCWGNNNNGQVMLYVFPFLFYVSTLAFMDDFPLTANDIVCCSSVMAQHFSVQLQFLFLD